MLKIQIWHQKNKLHFKLLKTTYPIFEVFIIHFILVLILLISPNYSIFYMYINTY